MGLFRNPLIILIIDIKTFNLRRIYIILYVLYVTCNHSMPLNLPADFYLQRDSSDAHYHRQPPGKPNFVRMARGQAAWRVSNWIPPA